ncbi:LLM class flavin-dependent oxidoreductase [Oceanibacterium hippocampi]|uniref:Alkanal monooxygenase alpha chain n=1 Tax=Oceanibacterium hippocampi TaxID=745714 RepID=A0A1Y5SKZ4_9PROT|nr:LLM class flavin-dependent oxidoreductase [Oceanibacterium hippocampi]SLN41995.1 Alkanal monooxygenase alpha chain [Oceanibacterium hippocampi]
MDFGIFNIMQQRDTSKSASQVFNESIEQTMVAEQLGYARSWYAEHHFSNYSLCPSPLMMCAHMAGRTTKIRVGTAVVVAPLYNPARLLAEIGMVDLLSGGRLDLGIGTGYQGYEFDRFGVDLANAREITSEVLDLIEIGLRAQAFEYNGQHLKQPRSSISCKPVQQPVPPIWYAGGDPDHLRRIARNDQTLFVSGVLGGVTRMKRTREMFEKAALAEGKDPKKVRLGVSRLAFVSNNKDDVRKYVECALYQQRLAVSLKQRREKVENDYIIDEEPYDEEPSIEAIMRNLPVGDVDSCIEKMVRLVRELRPVHICIQPQVGDMDHKKSLASMQLWAEEVIPAVLREVGDVQAAA